MSQKVLGVNEIAIRLKVSTARVRQLCKSKRLPSQKVGPFYTAREADVDRLAQELANNPRSNLFRRNHRQSA